MQTPLLLDAVPSCSGSDPPGNHSWGRRSEKTMGTLHATFWGCLFSATAHFEESFGLVLRGNIAFRSGTHPVFAEDLCVPCIHNRPPRKTTKATTTTVSTCWFGLRNDISLFGDRCAGCCHHLAAGGPRSIGHQGNRAFHFLECVFRVRLWCLWLDSVMSYCGQVVIVVSFRIASGKFYLHRTISKYYYYSLFV